MGEVTSAVEIRNNLARLEQQLGRKALHALLGEAVSYLLNAREGLEHCRDHRDWEAISRQLHQIKGSLVIYGSSELSRLLASAGSPSCTSHDALLNAINGKLSEALSILQTRIQELEIR